MPVDVPRHILCAVDLSERSAPALHYAATLSRCADARITALYAESFAPPPYFTESQVEALAAQIRDSAAAAKKSLAQFVVQVLGSGAPKVETKIANALPADAILRTAQETGADLIAMGTHGRSGFNRWMMGSVAERVLRESRIPVLVARQTAGAGSPGAVRRILCPVNDSDVARRSLQLAAKLAGCLGAALTVLHVQEQDVRGHIADLCQWVREQAPPQCEKMELSRQGEAAQEIIRVAAETGCDLLVMGARHRLFHDTTVLGTTTIRTVRHAPCAVWTVVEWPE
jgi:nucleotide-binding universal stress UspA family protein